MHAVKRIDSSLKCPSCSGPLRPVQLACVDCGIKVEGPFQLNEFATLAPEDLHFLRIFVRAEGRIREMETALGLSYPTIRTRLTALKNKLQGAGEGAGPGGERPPVAPTSEERVRAILSRLEAGEVSFEVAMQEIKAIRSS